MDSSRLERVASQMQRDLAEVFRGIAQSKFPGVLFTVTHVRVSADLSIARVNLSVFPVKDKEIILTWVEEQRGVIKNELVQKMKGQLRKMPELYFYIDDSLDKEAEIDRILKKGGDSPIQ
jgi:ribosome-binding factor A